MPPCGRRWDRTERCVRLSQLEGSKEPYGRKVHRFLPSRWQDKRHAGRNPSHADRVAFHNGYLSRRTNMPILLWLLGVPISVIILLLIFGVI